MSEPKTVQFPWPALLAVAAAIVGVVWYLAPLETSRPTERFGQAMGTQEMQDVDARLWQDPLLAAYFHIALDEKGQKKCQHEEFHQLAALTQDMSAGDFWVLPVVVPGGSYAEYNEIRLRSRRAVLEALGASGFSPKDGEHIGFNFSFSACPNLSVYHCVEYAISGQRLLCSLGTSPLHHR